MADLGKRKPDANATIQINLEELEQVGLDPNRVPAAAQGGEAAPASIGGDRVRSLPPPLPASVRVPAAKGGSSAKTIAIVAAFVALVGAAIALGVVFGKTVRGGKPQAAATSAAAKPTAEAPAPSAAASQPAAEMLVLPPVELKSEK